MPGQPPHSAAAPRSGAASVANLLDLSVVTSGRVVMIGLGGIGLPLTRFLVTFLAGIVQGTDESISIEMLLCDGDAFNESNTYRMDVPGFGNKAQVLGADLLERMDADGLLIRWIPQFATSENVATLVRDGDCVFLACDNHATRQLVGRHCAADLQHVSLISGGNDGVEQGLRGTYGNVQVHLRRRGFDVTAPLERFHPEIANPPDHPPSELSCLDLVAVGVPQILFANVAIASAMCNALLRLMMPFDGQPMYDEVGLDSLEAVCTPHWLSTPSE
jgi:hypothetical protein